MTHLLASVSVGTPTMSTTIHEDHKKRRERAVCQLSANGLVCSCLVAIKEALLSSVLNVKFDCRLKCSADINTAFI